MHLQSQLSHFHTHTHAHNSLSSSKQLALQHKPCCNYKAMSVLATKFLFKASKVLVMHFTELQHLQGEGTKLALYSHQSLKSLIL